MPQQAMGRPLVGILLIACATLSFAFADTLTKHFAAIYPVPVVVAIRYLVNVGLLAILLLPRLGALLWQANRIGLVLARALCLSVAALTMAWALRVMPLGETVAIVYLGPFLVMLLAMPLLGERVSTVGWAGAAFGFVGVLLIARPGGSLDPLGVTFALINAGVSTAYHLLTRLLSRTETTVSMLFHTAWVGAVIFSVMAIPYVPDFSPPLFDLALLLLLGALMTLGHFLFTAAYREAPASLLAPVNYLHLVWASGLGFLAFGHIPEFWSLVGIVMVTASGAAVALNTHLQRRRDQRAADEVPEPAVVS
ncbi:MAG: DMT family transporter [Devosia sp.]